MHCDRRIIIWRSAKLLYSMFKFTTFEVLWSGQKLCFIQFTKNILDLYIFFYSKRNIKCLYVDDIHLQLQIKIRTLKDFDCICGILYLFYYILRFVLIFFSSEYGLSSLINLIIIYSILKFHANELKYVKVILAPKKPQNLTFIL